MKKAYSVLLMDCIVTLGVSLTLCNTLSDTNLILCAVIFTLCSVLLIVSTAVCKPLVDTLGIKNIKLLSVKHTAIHTLIVLFVACVPIVIKLIL